MYLENFLQQKKLRSKQIFRGCESVLLALRLSELSTKSPMGREDSVIIMQKGSLFLARMKLNLKEHF